jgi:cephalosporin hydroxylase
MSRLSRFVKRVKGHWLVLRHPVLSKSAIMAIQKGTFRYRYKGVRMIKCPFDLALYTELIGDLRPGTILEIGSAAGGSALWFADQLRAHGLAESRVHSLDINPVRDVSDPLVSFGHIDLDQPSTWPAAGFIDVLRRPILLVDDASHRYEHVLAMLRFAHGWLRSGDYLAIEDGSLSYMPGYPPGYGGGPLRAIHEFLAEHPAEYRIDRKRCDLYGTNMTWNVDGYIARL